MTTLTVTSRGQVTFRRDVLQHLGIQPGEKIELDKLPDGRVTLRAARAPGTIDDVTDPNNLLPNTSDVRHYWYFSITRAENGDPVMNSERLVSTSTYR